MLPFFFNHCLLLKYINFHIRWGPMSTLVRTCVATFLSEGLLLLYSDQTVSKDYHLNSTLLYQNSLSGHCLNLLAGDLLCFLASVWISVLHMHDLSILIFYYLCIVRTNPLLVYLNCWCSCYLLCLWYLNCFVLVTLQTFQVVLREWQVDDLLFILSLVSKQFHWFVKLWHILLLLAYNSSVFQ